MKDRVVIITGAAGFLASAITVDLAKDHRVLAIDRRPPSDALRGETPGVLWRLLDIADAPMVCEAFRDAKAHLGDIGFVIHFAGFYHFGCDWLQEYERTNVKGTANVAAASSEVAAQRVIFASSIAAMAPPAQEESLTEESPTSDFIPYARSKSIGERILFDARHETPSAILRIGGVFSDWCELPPLYGLIRRWTGRGPASRVVPGRGESGMPYIHREDLVAFVRACLARHDKLGPFVALLASQHGAALHKQLFSAIRGTNVTSGSLEPIFISPKLAKMGLRLERALAPLMRHTPYEQEWMLDYVDRPWRVDTTKTRRTLDWDCTPALGVLDRIPVIMKNRMSDPQKWEERNARRNEGRYSYYPS